MAGKAPSFMLYSLLNGHASITGWSVGMGSEPDSPDNRITCIDTGGEPPNPRWLLDFPSVQVVVRTSANNYDGGFTIAKVVKDLCLGVDAQDIDGDRLVSVTLVSDVFYIGKDDSQRHKFTLNFNLITEPAASANTQRQAL